MSPHIILCVFHKVRSIEFLELEYTKGNITNFEVMGEDSLLIFFFQKYDQQDRKCTQFFYNRRNYTKIYPLQSEKEAHEALDMFIHEVGVPHELQTDGAKTLTGSEWKKM